MNRAIVILQGLLLQLVNLFVLGSPWLVALAVACARWDAQPSVDQHGQGLTIRGNLPRWAAWLETMDDRLPGGTYEPTVADWLARRGRFVCSVLWLWWRNRAQGAARPFMTVSTEEAYLTRFEADADGRISGVRSDGSWYWQRTLGPLRAVAGHRIYRILDGTYVAIPTATIKGA